MTSTLNPERATIPTEPRRAPLRRRPLMWLAALMAIATVATVALMIVDPREITGVNGWVKPVKFALSILLYAVTLDWLVSLLQGRLRRIGEIGAAVSAFFLLVEATIIIASAAVGETSHFNVSTPFHTAVYAVMAASIAIVWLVSLAVAFLLFRRPLGDTARSLAIRTGAVIGLVGMGLAFLMTIPQERQISDMQGIAGAHTVGLPDGGAGIPILGWSTVSGDLRIPHFVGMHALQLIPLLVIGLELLARRYAPLRDVRVRTAIVGVFAAAFSAVLVILTVQALSGESIVRPSAGIVLATLATITLVAIGVGVALRIGAAHANVE
jgi:hypothetical protein